jgi:hypothetical protein
MAVRNGSLLWHVAAAALLCLGVYTTLLTARCGPSAISRENYDRIHEGMTEREVEEVLGGPPGFYTDRLVAVHFSGIMVRSWWIGDEGVVTIGWTSDGPGCKVGHKEFGAFPPESLAEWCCRKCKPLYWWHWPRL